MPVMVTSSLSACCLCANWYRDTSITTSVFFFNDTATTEIYTLSLHDALPICFSGGGGFSYTPTNGFTGVDSFTYEADRKSTRLNSSHLGISYAVFCLKKKKR